MTNFSPRTILTTFLFWGTFAWASADEYHETIRPLLEKHCVSCHGKDKTKGGIDLYQILSLRDAEAYPDLWDAVLTVVEEGEMPPKDEPQLSEAESTALLHWIEDDFFGEIESLPAPLKPRRLSGPEYRNTMRSLFGFDLEVSIVEAEQTVTEKSLVLKLLPTDPPGPSGYINDTRAAKFSTNLWDQYAYLSDFALERYFQENSNLSDKELRALVLAFLRKANRRPLSTEIRRELSDRLNGKTGNLLVKAAKEEMKVALMSPGFLYRGMLVDKPKSQRKVDSFELAERLSYFLWEDMPDETLFELAENNRLQNAAVIQAQVDRMLASPKAYNLAESFGKQWLILDQIKHQRSDPTYQTAFRSQPIDFLNYLFTENRPVMELIDSKVVFFNANISSYYGNDRKKLAKVIKPKGTEKMIMPLQKVVLESAAKQRGAGILTTPGVLSMNKGPILRGTWIMRRILGEHLGEPPPDIPAIKSSTKGQNLSFRERFEAHRSDQSCALCHDKIDPIGFALDGYNDLGGVIGKGQTSKKGKKVVVPVKSIDTSGKLPSGESFANFGELHVLLLTTQKEKIVRNAVEQMFAYALCRKLERNDRPTVDALTERIVNNNGTWRDLIQGIATSVPFTETIPTEL